jgi:acyl homoserine lactone synthase/acyl-homoserine lactone synthase
LLDSFYPDLCDGEVPRGPCTFEITRFCLDRHQSGHERRTARDRLVSELVIAAIVGGIRCYTGVAEIGWFRQIRDFGWRCRALGEPRMHGRQQLAGLRIDIDEHTMDALAATGIYDPEPDEWALSFTPVAA